MKRKFGAFALLTAMLSVAVALTIAPAASSAQAAPTAAAPSTLDITGTIAQASGGGTFTGTLSNLHFVNQRGVLGLAGNLTGTLTNAAGTTLGTVTDLPITLPIGGAAATGSCTILDLTLGPLHLNLLGLVVDLNQVHLTITGQTGPGNLLGNLLCGLANALNGGGGLGGLTNLLNQLLGGL
jgi:hypothetical protein